MGGRLSARIKAILFAVLFGSLKFDAGGKVANGGFGSLVVIQSFFGYSVVAAACGGIVNKGVLSVLPEKPVEDCSCHCFVVAVICFSIS